MLFHTLGQPFILVACLCAGILIGFAYDFFRVLRRIFGDNTVITVLCDLLFSALFFAVSFVAFYVSNDMQVEWYMLPMEAVGILLYSLGVRKVLLFLWRLVYNAVRKVKNYALQMLKRRENGHA